MILKFLSSASEKKVSTIYIEYRLNTYLPIYNENSTCVYVRCCMCGDSVKQFHLYGTVRTKSRTWSFSLLEWKQCFELRYAASVHQNQTSYGNDCISSTTTSPLILLFIQWSQSSGLLGKWIHIYVSERAVIAGLVDAHQGNCESELLRESLSEKTSWH